MDLVDVIKLFGKWKWLMLTIVVVVLALTYIAGVVQTRVYRAEATLVVGLSQITSSSSSGLSIAQSGERIGTTYSELVGSRDVMVAAIDNAGLDSTPESLASRVSTSVVKNTPVIKVSTTDTDPDTAVKITNAVSYAFIDYIEAVSKTRIDDTTELLTEELAGLDQDIKDASAQPTTQGSEIAALEQRRQIVLDQLDGLLSQRVASSDLSVADEASQASSVGLQTSQRMIIGLAISLIAALAVAFIAEAVQKAVRWKNFSRA